MVPMMETDQDVVMSPVVSSTNTSVHKTQEKTENEDKKKALLERTKNSLDGRSMQWNTDGDEERSCNTITFQ